jgi:hypothetical protein
MGSNPAGVLGGSFSKKTLKGYYVKALMPHYCIGFKLNNILIGIQTKNWRLQTLILCIHYCITQNGEQIIFSYRYRDHMVNKSYPEAGSLGQGYPGSSSRSRVLRVKTLPDLLRPPGELTSLKKTFVLRVNTLFSRVARFFLAQCTKTGENTPNWH